MLRQRSSGPKYEKMFSRISSGRSFSDFNCLSDTDGSEYTKFLRLYEGNGEAFCNWTETGSKIWKHK